MRTDRIIERLELIFNAHHINQIRSCGSIDIEETFKTSIIGMACNRLKELQSIVDKMPKAKPLHLTMNRQNYSHIESRYKKMIKLDFSSYYKSRLMDGDNLKPITEIKIRNGFNSEEFLSAEVIGIDILIDNSGKYFEIKLGQVTVLCNT